MKIKGSTKLFTLTELLIVLAVFCVLLSLLSPALKNSIEVARGIVCGKKLSILPQWNFAYAEDHNGILVVQNHSGLYWTEHFLLQAGVVLNNENHEKYYACPSGRGSSTVRDRPAWGYCETIADWGTTFFSKKLSDIRRPSETLMYVESIGYFRFNPGPSWLTPASPHVKLGWQAYCDGHVSKLSQQEMLFYCKSFPNNIPWWSP